MNLELVEQHEDETDMRADLDVAIQGSLTFADMICERILAEPADVHLLALASSYTNLRRHQRRLRRRLISAVS